MEEALARLVDKALQAIDGPLQMGGTIRTMCARNLVVAHRVRRRAVAIKSHWNGRAGWW